jgi:hypothetical protein
MDLGRLELSLSGLCANFDIRLRTSSRRRLSADALPRMLSARLYRIYFDPGLAAVDEFDPGGLERPLHVGERSFVGQSRRLTFEIRDRFRSDFAGRRQFLLGPTEQSTSCSTLRRRKRHFSGPLLNIFNVV